MSREQTVAASQLCFSSISLLRGQSLPPNLPAQLWAPVTSLAAVELVEPSWRVIRSSNCPNEREAACFFSSLPMGMVLVCTVRGAWGVVQDRRDGSHKYGATYQCMSCSALVEHQWEIVYLACRMAA